MLKSGYKLRATVEGRQSCETQRGSERDSDTDDNNYGFNSFFSQFI